MSVAKQRKSDDRWIWPFELLDKIGEGAMGVVYRARSVTNNRIVALKLLPAEFSNDSTLTARFEREMEVLKTLKHPNIVNCYGGTCEGKRRFYAMELVDGGSLYELMLQRGPLPWNEMVKYAVPMCAALGYAHQRGVVHRDVKPSNFLLTRDGQIKLSDFGLVHIGTATKLTAAGKTMGTYQYMAPEQIRGKDTISAQTDLYALGCVFFEMLTGRPPYTGDTPAEILQQHLEAPPPKVSELVRDCPDPALADMVIARMMDKSIVKRPDSAEIVAEWLQQSVSGGALRTAISSAAMEDRGRQLPRTVAATTWQGPKKKFQFNQTWALIACSVMLVVMLIWNVMLLGRGVPVDPNTGFTRAQYLWVEALESPDEALHAPAAKALSEIAHDNERAIDVLVEGLDHERAATREVCAIALGEIGPKAETKAVARLKVLEKRDDDDRVRSRAREALVRIQGRTVNPQP